MVKILKLKFSKILKLELVQHFVADVDSEDHVGNSLLQIWELTFGPSDFEHKGWSRF